MGHAGPLQKDDLDLAAARVQGVVHRTPVLQSQQLDAITGAQLYFKCENFQKTGAFKYRGANNAVKALLEQGSVSGVATHSSGNHAAAVALAARQHNLPAWIVMPETAPESKKKAVAGYGGRITYCEATLQARETTLEAVIAETGAAMIHPYNNYNIIAGQSTAARELLEDIPDLDAVIAPVGGGGLLSGTSLSVYHHKPAVRVFGAEPKLADDAYKSFKSGSLHPPNPPRSIADGLLTALGEKTFDVIKNYVDDIFTVDEASIIEAMRLVWERMKIVIEPSAAVPLAVLLEESFSAKGLRIGIIISGGNLDLDHLPWQK